MLYRKIMIGILGLLLLGLYLGCSSDGDDIVDDGDNGHPSGFDPVFDTLGDDGGVIGETGYFTLYVPSGALSTDVPFFAMVLDSPLTAPGTMCMGSLCYMIEPGGTDFALPATLTIYYDEGDLHGVDEDSIRIYRGDGVSWSPVTTTVYAADNIATAQITHLSDYVIMVDTGSASSGGVFAAMVVGRMITHMAQGVNVTMDQIVARFDSTFAPCTPAYPRQADSVKCDQYKLEWDGTPQVQHYAYWDMYHLDFLSPGMTYTFNVYGNDQVPSLTRSVWFPNPVPSLTAPEPGATLSLSGGFTATWSVGGGASEVRFVLMSGGDSTGVSFNTANDGSHVFTPAQLSSLTAGEYGLLMIHQITNAIDAEGYDSRSYVWSRVMEMTTINLQ